MAKSAKHRRPRGAPAAPAAPAAALDILSPRTAWCAVAVVLLAAGAARISAARGELWFDEVFSIRLVEDYVAAPLDVFRELKADNNHFLNSLWIAAIDSNAADWVYRAPAVLAGTLTVLAAAWALRRDGPSAILAAAVLTGGSYLLVQYSSEARGYAYLLLFATLGYACDREADASPNAAWDALFAVCCSLGFLAHPAMLGFYAAAQVWTWYPGASPRLRTRQWASVALLRTIVPILVLGVLYWVNLRDMQVAGGNPQPYLAVIAQTLSLSIGGPFDAPGIYVAACAAIGLLGVGLWFIGRESPRRAAFYLTTIMLAPAAMLLLAPRDDIYPRYFLLSVLFLLLVLAELLAALRQRWGLGRWTYAGALALFVVANAWPIAQLVAVGRGHYGEAAALLNSRTDRPTITVAADHQFRNELLLDYYHRAIPDAKPLAMATADEDEPVEWNLTHHLDRELTPPRGLVTERGQRYHLVRHYPFAGLSGWHLCVYRLE